MIANSFFSSCNPQTESPQRTVSWLDAYAPATVTDLAVHKKKIEELSEWLNKAVNNASDFPMVLLITGPAGCGKTVTLQCLADSMNVLVKEWINPVTYTDEEGSDMPVRLTQAEGFKKYLMETGRMAGLLDPEDKKKLILVQDVPNVFTSACEKFHDILCEYCLSCRVPLVFILTDGVTSSGTYLSNILFPQLFSELCMVTKISFNPVSTTGMQKAVKRIVSLARFPLDQKSLKDICDVARGDVRNAVLMLQCALTGVKCVKETKRLGRQKQASKKQHSLEGFEGSDIFLGSLRNVGRVVYANRDSTTGEFEHDPYKIAEQFACEAGRFVDLLQENYVHMFSRLSDVEAASERISDADILLASLPDQEVLQELGVGVAVTGIMCANKFPVRKWQPIKMSKKHTIYLQNQENLKWRLAVASHVTNTDSNHLQDCCGFKTLIECVGLEQSCSQNQDFTLSDSDEMF
ncbi:cell cycle checkpoint protein RAD17 [Bacillus rossius redtenbacheri]|uniref:cell cycle checkpoint protein RAD17 n=1 Tax=Bacillus rossius redtenbacheri TaxID=93214 RepID=UPI002FDE49AE